MTPQLAIADPYPARAPRLRKAGAASACAVRVAKGPGHKAPKLAHSPEELQAAIAAAARDSKASGRAWLLDNARLIRTAVKETGDLHRSLRDYPVAVEEFGVELPRILVLAREYVRTAHGRFSEEDLAAFLEGYQEIAELEMGEIWALKPALQFTILERLAAAPSAGWPVLISSLRHIGEASWKEFF
jgi:hypothetical protein